MYDNCITWKKLCNQSTMNQLNCDFEFNSKVISQHSEPQKLYFLIINQSIIELSVNENQSIYFGKATW